MIEQEPRLIDLTKQANPHRLERRGDIFMPGEPGGGEVASQQPTELLKTKALTPKAIIPPRESIAGNNDHPAPDNARGKDSRENAAQLRKEWHAVFTPEELNNPDTRSTIEAAISLGYGPSRIVGKGSEALVAKDVVANSLLSQEKRIAKAEELLHRALSPKEQEALLKAHNTGAGIYRNLRAQLEEKVVILRSEGFSKEEIRTIIEAGLAATPIPPADYPDVRLQNVITELNEEITRGGVGNPLEPLYVQEQRARVRGLLDQGLVDPAQANRLLVELNSWMREAQTAAPRQERGSSIRLYLEQKDIDVMEVSPMTWLDSKFDMIYQFVDQGRELDSPQIKQLEQMFTVGANYISTYAAELHMTPDQIKEFITSFNTRLNLIFLRSAIEHRNMESAKQATERLQAHGLFTALAMENGNVNKMFSRMAEFLEDKRLAQEDVLQELSRLGNSPADRKTRNDLLAAAKEFHITPEMMSRLRDDLISEQLSLAERGVGQYSEIYNNARAVIQGTEGERRRALEATGLSAQQIDQEINNLIKAEVRKNAEPLVRRSVRTAYDVLTVSQRQAVIVARGHRLPGPMDNYMSDPSGLFNVFNYEDLLTGKFNIFNKPAAEFLAEMKRDIAISKLEKQGIDPKSLSEEELLDYGKRMFRDLFAVPDFFSSGWRIKGIAVATERRIRADNPGLSEQQIREKAKDFGLFLQLKAAGGDNGMRLNAWGRIAEIRPEEIVRLYRERAAGNTELTAQMESFFEGDVFESLREYRLDAAGQRINKRDGNGNFVRDANGNLVYEFDAFKTYDKFKKEFGPLIQSLRQQGYDEFQVLKVGQDGFVFNENQRVEIIKYFDGNEAIGSQKAEQLREMFKHLSEIAGEGATIDRLMRHIKFEDIYTRTLLVDDALLDKLESPPPGSGIAPISEYWTSEVGGDALVRNYKDTENAAKAAHHLLKFIYTEDSKERIKSAQEFAEFTSQYNGQGGRAECIRYTVGSLLNMSKQDFIWDALGIGKLPFRQSMSKIEKIYGPQAKPMSRDEIRVHVDNIHSMMVASIDRTNKTPEEIREEELKVEGTYRELVKLLEIDPKNMAKRRAASFLIYLMLATVLEAGLLGKSVAKEK